MRSQAKTINVKQINGSKSSLMGHTWKGSLALETINVNYPADQWLQVFTDGSYIENQANVGAGVYSELFLFYAAVGYNRSTFEGEIEAIRIALCQLCCLDTKFTKAVILSDSQSAIDSIGNREPPKTAEMHRPVAGVFPHDEDPLIRREFKTTIYNELEARTKEKHWKVTLSTKNRSRC
ncbi:unnamed protein product [Rodentolepis nana]|uniref:RNase H domain-containing protein n=1 Tax=Rodentolepis nana TaxID=102285 RepID=A0A0R3TYI7_RODNA|nr:unnamed protein product [Rodentolepis nana]